jgi:hypothetical protein
MATSWDPRNLIKAAEKSGVKYDVDTTWLKVDPYPGTFDPVGVVWHHTACGTLSTGNMPSLGYCRNPGIYTGISRACHVVVGRDGFMQIIAGRGAYHAGAGGPLTVNGTRIPKDIGNRYLIGFEIEASSTAKVNRRDIQTPKWNMNPAQFEAMVNYCAALFELLDWDTSAAIRHKDWAPDRKIDVGIPLSDIRNAIDEKRALLKPPPPKPKPEPTPKPPVQEKPKPPVAPKPKPPAKPVILSKNVQPKSTHPSVSVLRAALAEEFPKLINADKPGYFGANTKALYRKWQLRCGFTGADADGIPGVESLRKLGKKYGFSVRAS